MLYLKLSKYARPFIGWNAVPPSGARGFLITTVPVDSCQYAEHPLLSWREAVGVLITFSI